MTRHIVAGHPYLAAGAQNLYKEEEIPCGIYYCLPPHYVYVNAVAMNQVGAGTDKIKIWSSGSDAVEADLLFFLAA